MDNKRTPPSIWHGQLLHLISLVILLITSWLSWTYVDKPLMPFFWLAITIPIVHQVFVWLSWRFELRSSLTSQFLGFKGYLVIFFILFGSRFLALLTLAWLDRGSLGLQMLPQTVISMMLLLPGMYAMYSVKRYFGMSRAAGADHFDPGYRTMPLVRRGMFRFTGNAMYVYAFLLFWAIAIGFNSSAALIVAAFSHLYIWVHFYCTEKPDMDYIYGADEGQ